MGAQPSYNTMITIEQNLLDAGFKPGQAAALIKSMAEAASFSTDNLATKQELALMESRIETAIATQTASLNKSLVEIHKQFALLPWQVLGGVAALLAIAAAIDKFWQ